MTDPIRLAPGDTAPDFTLPDQNGEPLTLSSLRGKKVIVYFYPEAMTPGCTTQACDFRDSLNQLNGAGYQVVGISRDDVPKLAKFVKNDHLTFPILSDPDHHIHDQWGTFGKKLMYGKRSSAPCGRRSCSTRTASSLTRSTTRRRRATSPCSRSGWA